jgi:hypothetical protein
MIYRRMVFGPFSRKKARYSEAGETALLSAVPQFGNFDQGLRDFFFQLAD